MARQCVGRAPAWRRIARSCGADQRSSGVEATAAWSRVAPRGYEMPSRAHASSHASLCPPPHRAHPRSSGRCGASTGRRGRLNPRRASLRPSRESAPRSRRCTGRRMKRVCRRRSAGKRGCRSFHESVILRIRAHGRAWRLCGRCRRKQHPWRRRAVDRYWCRCLVWSTSGSARRAMRREVAGWEPVGGSERPRCRAAASRAKIAEPCIVLQAVRGRS